MQKGQQQIALFKKFSFQQVELPLRLIALHSQIYTITLNELSLFH